MKVPAKYKVTLLTIALSALTPTLHAQGPRPSDLGAVELPIGSEAVVWHSTWDSAKAEAKRSNRPILFMAAAHQCGSISGTF
ncbi:MAG: hypothetical protein ACSHX6_13395 [Akkermansiaceae bacterium]